MDEFAMLTELLCSASDQRYALAKSYIQSSGLPDVTLAGFLCDAILESLQISAGIVVKGTVMCEYKSCWYV